MKGQDNNLALELIVSALFFHCEVYGTMELGSSHELPPVSDGPVNSSPSRGNTEIMVSSEVQEGVEVSSEKLSASELPSTLQETLVREPSDEPNSEVPESEENYAPYNPSIYDFQVLDCYRELYDLSQHRGAPLLIVNVASKCNKYSESCYKLLCTLYERYSEYGFSILAFPCSQFGNTEPFKAEDLEVEVPKLYPNSVKAIEFPIMSKVDVNGDGELPLYGYLKSCLKGGVGQTAINWNFTYFLINNDGIPVMRSGPETKVEEFEKPIRQLLGIDNEDPSNPTA